MSYKRISPQPVNEGGTGLSTITAHDLIIGNGTSAPNLLAPSATSGIPLVSQGSSADPAYSTAVVAGGGTGQTSLTAHYTLVGNATTAVTMVAPSATAGIPYVSNGASADPSFTTAVVAGGGTGVVTMTTAYAPVCAGTTATGALQVASSGLGTAGFVLTSTGSSSLPTWQAGGSSATLTLTYTAVNNAASPYTVLTTDQYIGVDSSGGAVSILLPNGPATGRVFTVKDSTGSAATHNITITTVGGSVNIDGATTYVMNVAYESHDVIFNGSNYEIW